ncbi:DoxX family protein [Marinomonas agarivorans]|nr:DoxX family protein [Marinomonas agarivorans]
MNQKIDFLKELHLAFFAKIERLLQPVLLLALRWHIGCVFLLSGMTKWMGPFDFNEGTYDIFLYEFFCPEEKRPGALFLCDPETMDYTEGSSMIAVIESLALMAGIMEIILPVLLIIGLFTRFAALGLLGMIAFIQLAVFPEWEHWVNPASWWFAVASVILIIGPGKFSLDRLFGLEEKKLSA